MKKNVLIIILVIVVAVLGFVSYNTSNQLSESIKESESVKSDLLRAEKNVEELEEVVVEGESLLEDKAVEIQELNDKVRSKTDEIIAIDKQLQANGKISEKIERLMTENRQWSEELTNLSKDLDDLEIQVADSNENDEDKIQAIDDLLVFVNDRAELLEETVSNLPVLSLERIMINQEIEFLEEAMNDIEALKETL